MVYGRFDPEELERLQKALGYHFHDKGLLQHALIHRSYINESQLQDSDCNERLEFLGDAVLELVVSDCLFHQYPDKDEGALTQKRIQLVCEPSFAYLANQLGLSQLLLMGHGEELQGGRERDSIASDAFEALCGAIYLDGGYDFIYDYFAGHLDEILRSEEKNQHSFKNYKSLLQEKLNKAKQSFEYVRLGKEGPAHDPTFHIALKIDGEIFSQGSGKNVKAAEQAAARQALQKLDTKGHSDK